MKTWLEELKGDRLSELLVDQISCMMAQRPGETQSAE